MPTQHNAVAAGILFDRPFHHHGQLKARPLPRHPHQPVAKLAIELVHFCFAVGARRQCNRPIGVQMIHMRKRQKSVQRRVNGRGHRIVLEGAQRIHRRDLIFGVDTLVLALQRQQLLHVERGKARALDRTQVAARALHPQHFHRLARKRIGFHDLRAGVASGKIGNAQVRT